MARRIQTKQQAYERAAWEYGPTALMPLSSADLMIAQGDLTLVYVNKLKWFSLKTIWKLVKVLFTEGPKKAFHKWEASPMHFTFTWDGETFTCWQPLCFMEGIVTGWCYVATLLLHSHAGQILGISYDHWYYNTPCTIRLVQ